MSFSHRYSDNERDATCRVIAELWGAALMDQRESHVFGRRTLSETVFVNGWGCTDVSA